MTILMGSPFIAFRRVTQNKIALSRQKQSYFLFKQQESNPRCQLINLKTNSVYLYCLYSGQSSSPLSPAHWATITSTCMLSRVRISWGVWHSCHTFPQPLSTWFRMWQLSPPSRWRPRQAVNRSCMLRCSASEQGVCPTAPPTAHTMKTRRLAAVGSLAMLGISPLNYLSDSPFNRSFSSDGPTISWCPLHCIQGTTQAALACRRGEGGGEADFFAVCHPPTMYVFPKSSCTGTTIGPAYLLIRT